MLGCNEKMEMEERGWRRGSGVAGGGDVERARERRRERAG